MVEIWTFVVYVGYRIKHIKNMRETLITLALIALVYVIYLLIKTTNKETVEDTLMRELLNFAKKRGEDGFTYEEAHAFVKCSANPLVKSSEILSALNNFLHGENWWKYLRCEEDKYCKTTRYFFLLTCYSASD